MLEKIKRSLFKICSDQGDELTVIEDDSGS